MTWRKLLLPSFSDSTRKRLRPPFLASSCYPDMKIEIAEPQLHWSCGLVNQHLCYTAQSVPYCTTTAHYLITTHQLITLHRITILINMYNQPVPINLFLTSTNSVNLSLHTKLSPPGSNQLLIHLNQSESNQMHIRKLVPIFLNWTNLYQDACVPVPNQSYTCVNLIKCSDSQPTLITWPSSSSKTHLSNQDTSHIVNQNFSNHTQLNHTTTNLNHSQGILES